MSYQYTVTERRRRTGASAGYGASNNRTTFGYWVPLVLTVGAAAVGVAAWIWSERREDEEDSDQEHYSGGIPPPGYASMSGAMPPGPGPMGMQSSGAGPGMPGPPQQGGFQDGGSSGGFQGGPPPPGWEGGDMYGASRSVGTHQEQDSGLVARMSSALGMGRSSTPNQTLNWASQQVAAGFAAAGAMVGGALSSARDGDQGEYRDHERWSEEAEQRDTDRNIKQGIKRRGTADEYFSGAVDIPPQARSYNKKRRSVAIVVSAVDELGHTTELGHHAVSTAQHPQKHVLTSSQSILAHLPEHIDPMTTRVFVLIYAPDLKSHPLLVPAAKQSQSQSMASSFSNISHPDESHDLQTPGDYPTDQPTLSTISPNPLDESSSLYKTLHNQALALVDRESMVLPFTSPKGHTHILKSLGVETVYIQESLCGSAEEGEVVADLAGWVRQIVVVVGDEGGAGGLVDTDDEVMRKRKGGGPDGGKGVWWMREERTGLGKRVAVVEGGLVGEDWRRRVNGMD